VIAAPEGGRTAAAPGVHLTLLSRAYCHLCDDMRAALAPLAAQYRASVTVIDVDAEPALEARFGERVPVLILGSAEAGVELCHHRLDAGAVARALSAALASGH
jgi:thiol-disulfide isomerase/thioredoxin